MKNFILLIAFGWLFASCGGSQKIKGDPQNETGIVTIKIVQMNDVYEIAPLGGGEYGGLARVGHIRDSIQARYPNTFLFLAGDFLNPSLLGTLKVDGERLNGKQMVEVLNVMELDLAVFGNHEFDLKENDLQKRLDESEFEWLTANALHKTKSGIVPFASRKEGKNVPASDYSVFEIPLPGGDNLKFGVFGVTIPSNPKDYVYYGDIFENAERSYNLALKESDFVVGLTHVTIDQDKEIASRLKTVPLIMGGHEHYNMLEKEGQTIISKADANAKSIYVHTLKYNRDTDQLVVDSELMMITDRIAAAPQVKRVVDKWTGLLDEQLKKTVDDPDSIIYYAEVPLDGTDGPNRSRQTNMGKMIAHATYYVYRDEAQGALVNGGSIRLDDTLEGGISSKDIFRVLPFGGSVLKVELTGKLLLEVLEYGNQQGGTGAYLQRYNFSQNTKGDWQLGGVPIEEDEVYTVAFSDYLLKGLDIPFLTPDNEGVIRVYTPKETETAGDIRNAIITYLQALEK